VKKDSAGKLQKEGSNDMTPSTLKNRSSSSSTASSRSTTSHQELTRNCIAEKTKAEDEQSSSSAVAKIFGGATSSKYSWGEDVLVRNQHLLGVPSRRCSCAPPSNNVRPDRQSSWERLNAVAEGKIEGTFGRFEQLADDVFPSFSYRVTSTEEDDGSLNEKEILQDGGKSSQEERMNASCPSLGTSCNDPRIDLQRLNASYPSFGTEPKDFVLAGITRPSISSQPTSPVGHQYNCLYREAQKGGVSDTTTSTKHGHREEVLWNRVFHGPPNFDSDDTFACL
jgi:hypothetical protein